MDDVRDLIRRQLEATGQDMASVSRQLGRNHAYLQQYLNRGVPRVLSPHLCHELARILSLPPSSLTAGAAIDPKLIAALQQRATTVREVEPSQQEAPATAVMPRDIPVMGVAVGGEHTDFSLNGAVVDYARRPPGLAATRGIFAVYVVGSSMSPRFEEGEMIYLNPNRPPIAGDDVVIEMAAMIEGEAGDCFLKRLVRRTATHLHCRQFNPARDDLRYPLATIYRVYRVIPVTELLAI